MAAARYDSEDQILLEAELKADDNEEMKKESNDNFNVSIEIQENAGGEGENPGGDLSLSTTLTARMAKARKNRNRNRKRRNKNRTINENSEVDMGESDINNDLDESKTEITKVETINTASIPELQQEKSSDSKNSFVEIIHQVKVNEPKMEETDVIDSNVRIFSYLIPEEKYSNTEIALVEPFKEVPSSDNTTEPESVVSIRTLLDRAKDATVNDSCDPPMEKSSLKILYLAEEVTLCDQLVDSEPIETKSNLDASAPSHLEIENIEYLDKEWDSKTEEDRLNNNYWPPDSKSKVNVSTSISFVTEKTSAGEDHMNSTSELHLKVPNPSREYLDEGDCKANEGVKPDCKDCCGSDVQTADYRGDFSVAHRSLFRSEHPDLIAPFITAVDNILQRACEKVELLENDANSREDAVLEDTPNEESFVANQVSDSLHNLLEVKDGEYSEVYPQEQSMSEDVENETENIVHTFDVSESGYRCIIPEDTQVTLARVKEFFDASSASAAEDSDWHSACSENNHGDLRSPVSEGPSEYFDAHSLASATTSVSTIKEENNSLTSGDQNSPPSVGRLETISLKSPTASSKLKSNSENNVDIDYDFLYNDEETTDRSPCMVREENPLTNNSYTDENANKIESFTTKIEDSVTVIPLHHVDSPFTSQSQVSDCNSGGFHVGTSKIEVEVESSTKANKSQEFASKHKIDPLIGVNKTRRRFLSKNEVSHPAPIDVWKVDESIIAEALATNLPETPSKEERKWYSWMFPCVPKKKDRRSRSVSNDTPDKSTPRRSKRDFSLPRSLPRLSRAPKFPSAEN